MRTCGLGRRCLCSWSVSVRGRVILLGSTTTSRTWATTPAISSRLYSSAQTDSKIEDDWSISVKVSGEYCILVNLILLRTNCHFFYCIIYRKYSLFLKNLLDLSPGISRRLAAPSAPSERVMAVFFLISKIECLMQRISTLWSCGSNCRL